MLTAWRRNKGVKASVVLPKYRYLANHTGSKLFSQMAIVETILSKVRRTNEALETLH